MADELSVVSSQPLPELSVVESKPLTKPGYDAKGNIDRGQPENDTRSFAQRLREAKNPGSFEGHPENVASYVSENAGAIGGGAKDIAQGQLARGAHKIIGGVMGAAAPVITPFAAAAAPVATGAALAGGYAGQKLGVGAAQVAGATPDQQDLAGDIGGMAAGYGAAKIPGSMGVRNPLIKIAAAELDKVPPAAKFNPALNNTPREVLLHAAQEGIELTPAQATQLPAQRMVQSIGERSLFGARQLTQGIDRNAGAFINSVRDFADRSDPKAMGLSEESAGEAIKQSAQTAKQVAHDNAADGYKQIDYLMPEKVNAAPITNKWNQLKDSLPLGVEDTIRAQVPRSMRGVVEDMFSAKPEGFKPTFEQALKLRSFFRELGDTEGLPNSQQAAFRQLSGSADSAMETTALAKGSTAQWRSANAGWKDYTTKYGDPQSPLTKILKTQDPKQITNLILNRSSAADIETLKNEGMDSALDAVKRQVIEDVARNKFNAGRNGLGGYSDSFLNTLFGPEGVKELYLKGEIGRRFNWQQNPSGTSNVMMSESQITHPEPSKLGLLYGAAKASMPRPALDYLKANKVGTSTPARLTAGVPLSRFLQANNEDQ